MPPSPFEALDPLASTLQILLYAFDFVFDFWPLALLGVLRGRCKLISRLLAVWVIWTLFRILGGFNPTPFPPFLIPEPLSTILFVSVGLALFATRLIAWLMQRANFRRKIGRIDAEEQLLSLSPGEFEEMVTELYRAAGHKAKRTGAVGDHGVDIVVQSREGRKWIAQCKRWRGTVGEPVVRDFYGVMQHEKADRGLIVTTGRFTPQARAWAKGKPITLYDGEQFMAVWDRVMSPKDRP